MNEAAADVNGKIAMIDDSLSRCMGWDGAVWTLTRAHEYLPRLSAFRKRSRREPERLKRRCALPGCEETTTHNGGYCCARHCLEHRQRIAQARVKGEDGR